MLRFEILIVGEEALLFNFLSIASKNYFVLLVVRWIIVVIVIILMIIFFFWAFRSCFTIGWLWWVTGFVLSVVAIGVWFFFLFEYCDYGLSFVQLTNAFLVFVLFGDLGGVNWTSWFLIAFIFGAFVVVWRGGDLSLCIFIVGRFL